MDLVKKLGFRTADEMDIHIANVAVRTSWVITIIALLISSLYGFIREGSITPSFIPLGLGLAVYFATIIYMRKKLGNGNQE
jgi:hypothetical protein